MIRFEVRARKDWLYEFEIHRLDDATPSRVLDLLHDRCKTYEEFKAKYPDESGPAWEAVTSVATFGETIATLVKYELFNEQLCLDWLDVKGIWNTVAPMVLAWRAEMGMAALFENFEWLASRAR